MRWFNKSVFSVGLALAYFPPVRALWLLALLLGSSPQFVAAQGPSTIRIEFYPQNPPHTNPAILYLNGRRYEANPLIPPSLESLNVADELKFLSHVIATNRDGKLEDILSLWDPKERDSIRKLASDPASFAGNRKFFQSIAESHLLATVNYGAYEIFFVIHIIPSVRTFVKQYPVKNLNGQMLLTNDLQADPLFIYLATKYSEVLRQTGLKDK